MEIAVSTSDLHAEGSLMENTSAKMSPVACQANTGTLMKLNYMSFNSRSCPDEMNALYSTNTTQIYYTRTNVLIKCQKSTIIGAGTG